MDQNSPKNIIMATTPRFNIIMSCMTTIILLLIFVYPATHFFSNDATLPPSLLKPEQLKTFSFTQSPIEVGMYIKNFQEFNITKGAFTIDAIVWFLFDPRVISLARIEKFSFELYLIWFFSFLKVKVYNYFHFCP